MFETATSKAFICSITLVHIFQTTHNHFSIFRTPIRAVSHFLKFSYQYEYRKEKRCKTSHGRCSIWKNLFKIFLKFSGKHLRSFSIKSFTKGILSEMFSGKFCNIFKNTIFTEHLRASASVHDRYFKRGTFHFQ